MVNAKMKHNYRSSKRGEVMAKFMKVFLNHVRDGAEAMDVCVQDPPKSGVDLEGA